MFYFLKKKVVVDCFVNHPTIAEHYSIQKSIKLTPDWWKKLESFYTRSDNLAGISVRQNTMKTCPGFVDLYRSSWTIPLWMDIFLRTSEEGSYTYLTPCDMGFQAVSSHDVKQHGDNFQNFIQLKLTSPWLLFEKRGVQFAFLGNDWELLKKHPEVKSLPGVVNFKSNHSTNFNMFLPKVNAEYNFLAGLPLVQIIPLTDHKVEFRAHSVTDSEYQEVMKRANIVKVSFDLKNRS